MQIAITGWILLIQNHRRITIWNIHIIWSSLTPLIKRLSIDPKYRQVRMQMCLKLRRIKKDQGLFWFKIYDYFYLFLSQTSQNININRIIKFIKY